MKSEEYFLNVEQLFRQAIFEVMEKMYFIFLEPISYEEARESEWHAVEVRFSGTWKGKIEVYFSLPLVTAMMENALGVKDAEMDEQLQEDTLKECVNMIAGNFLQKFEPEKAYRLTIPQYWGRKGPREGDGGIMIALVADGDPMLAGLAISPAK